MLTMKDIIREGHPTLVKKADPVELPLSEEDKQTLIAMRQFIIDSQDEALVEQYELRPGVGLSAPQINISKRMFAIYTEDENFETLHDYMMINPRLIGHTELMFYMPGGEGCLSVDRDIEGMVPRYKRIRIRTHLLDAETGNVTETELKLKGFVSIVCQHELDHLNGILFVDKTKNDYLNLEPLQFKKPENIENEEDQQ